MKKREPKHGRHTVTMLTDHLVFTPKFRHKVLVGEVASECERLIKRICADLEVEILKMAVSEDHVHLFLRYSPELSASVLAERIKSRSSRALREKFPHLVKWCKTALWAPGCYHGSVGQGFDVVEKYIASQRGRRK